MTIDARFQLQRGDFALDVEFRAPASGVTAIFGPSGCGKTTLLRCIAGLERARGGVFRIGDDIWQCSDPDVFMPVHRRPIGYVFQEASLFAHLSVRRNIEYGWRRTGRGERQIGMEDAVALTGIEPLLERDPAQLSGGERQRVAIARALLSSPQLLLMDEPLSGLDHASRQEILPWLERLHESLSIPMFYVTHQPDEVARLADHIVLMGAGRVLAVGPIAEILTRLDLPPAHAPDAETIIETTVGEHDERFQLTYLDFAGGRFSVAREDFETGRKVRLRVHARDVSLALEKADNTSILNIFPARVIEVAEDSPAQVVVRLDAGGAPLLARITRKSAVILEIVPGREVYAQVKSVAVSK